MTTYTPIARLPIMTPGDPAVRNAWGTILNAAFPLIEQLAAGNGPLDITGLSAYTLTTANDAADQARQAILPFIGSLSADCTVTIPPVARIGWVTNSTSGNANVVLTTGTNGGATLIVSPGSTLLYSCDGINVTSVSLGASGPLNATPGVLVGNGSWYAGKDTGGITRNLLSLGTDNVTHLRLGSAGARVESQDGNTALWTINANGTATFSNTLTLSSGGLVVSSGGMSCTVDLSVGRDATVVRNLHVVGQGTIDGNVSALGLLLKDQTSTPRSAMSVASDGYLTLFGAGGGGVRFSNQSATLQLLAVDPTGNLGVSNNCNVSGDVNVGGNVGTNGLVVFGTQTTISSTGTFMQAGGIGGPGASWTAGLGINVIQGVAAAGFFTPSDRRLKSDIEGITPADGMRYVNEARPRTFTMDGVPSAGFIAQEEMDSEARAASISVMPDDRPQVAEAEGDVPSGHRLAKNYLHDIAYLTAALQGAMAQIAELQTRLEVLESAPR